MKLYKYMPCNRAIGFFSLPLLKLSNPNGLNDPFEFSLTREVSLGIESMHRDQGTREDGFRSYIENFKSFGVISLSETYDNLLMWSHYADEHRGAVFEFDIEEGSPDSLFLIKNTALGSDLKHFGKVDYRKFRKYQDLVSSSAISDIRRHYIFTKSDEWMYEKEQRFALHYSCADIVKVKKQECENAFRVQNLDYSQLESGGGVTVDGEDLWIDIRGSTVSAEILKQMWIMTKHMESSFFKAVDFTRVTKLIIGCRHNGDAFEQVIKNTQSPVTAGKFFHEGEFVGVLKARPSEERFELDFEEYRGEFFSMIR